MVPCSSHWLTVFSDVNSGENLLNAAELGQGVDFVSAKGVKELLLVKL